jgi:hypothetical protein
MAIALEPDCGSSRRASSIEFSAGALMATSELQFPTGKRQANREKHNL